MSGRGLPGRLARRVRSPGMSAEIPRDAEGRRLCEYCGDPVPESLGTKPRRYCSRSHRQRAYEARRTREAVVTATAVAVARDRAARTDGRWSDGTSRDDGRWSDGTSRDVPEAPPTGEKLKKTEKNREKPSSSTPPRPPRRERSVYSTFLTLWNPDIE